MYIQLPEKVTSIINCLIDNGYEAYAVGGCVRDTILNRVPGDWDITTSAKPEQVKALFRRTIDTGIEHGTVTVMIQEEGFEVTTYRIDGEYEDSRHPKNVTYTASLLEDLKRRDFTINAMAYNEKDGLIDAFDGVGDIEKGVIRCVGNAMDRFTEDALRMLRAVRFGAQLGFEIETDTKAAIQVLAQNLSKISAERIQVELVKLLTSKHPEEMRTVYELGISKVILPEFDAMMEEQQNNPHHCYSVGEHSIHAMEQVERDKVLRLAMLLHDVAKPSCRTCDDNGINHYYGHQKAGAEMARKIFRRLKFDCDTMNRVCKLIEWHDDAPALNEKSVRRAIQRVGIEQYPALFEVKRADVLAQSTYHRQEKISYIEEYERIYNGILEREECLCIKDLAINGKDLIEAGMKPGKAIGDTLNALLELVLEDPKRNTKEDLLSYTLKNLFI